VCGSFENGKPDLTAQLAYLTARYLETSDKQTAVSLSQFGRAQYHDSIPIFYQARYDQMKAEAEANAGPKDALVEVDADNLLVWYGLVRDGETDHAAAHYFSGYQATLEITTPNVTFADGTQKMTVTTKAEAASVALKPRHDLIADEPVTVTIKVTGIESACFLVHKQGETQRTITPLWESAMATDTDAPDETKWQPKVTSEIGSTVVAKGTASVADRVKAEAVNSQWPVREWANAIQTEPKTYYSFVASGTVVRAAVPPAASATLPSGATVVGDPVKVTLPGPGTWVTADVPVPATGSGHYAVRWCLDAADQGGNAKYLPKGGPFCDDYFSVTERFLVPMTLALSSELPDQYRAKGEAPDDTITISLSDPADTWMSKADGKAAVVKVTGTFYAGSASSFTISDTPPADAQVLGTATVNVTLPTSGRDPVTAPAPAGFTVPSSRYGTWVWQINRADQAADVAVLFDNDPVDKFGQTLETHVTQMDLAIHSEVTAATVPEPKGDATVEVCDVVWVEHSSPEDLWLNQWGTSKPVEVLVNGSLYYSAVPGTQTLSPDPGIPVVAEYELTFAAAGKDHAQTVCHTVGYGDYGAYGFTYTIDLGNQPAATKDYLAKSTATPLWLPVETTMVRRVPVIHTAAVQWSATNNGVEEVFFTDEIWQIDWPDSADDSDAYGSVGHRDWAGYGEWEGDGQTITVDLWRIEGEVTPDSCAADNPNATLLASNSATPAWNTWGASQKVSGSRFKAAGGDATYTFVVTWPGDARTEPYRSVCGEPSETIRLVHEAPSFITQLVTDRKGTSVETAQARETAIEVEAGAKLTDLLHVWFPGEDRQTDLTGWTVTWDAHWQAIDDTEPRIVADTSGTLVYADATCTADTLLASSDTPVPVTGPGTVASGEFTMPDQPGLLYVVETVTDNTGQIVRRGTCGVIGETAILTPPPPPAPEPKITTLAPEHADVGQQITDEASLTGPFPKGTQVEFWYQFTEYINPGAARDALRCETPDPDDMTGAVKIGVTTLDHDIAEGDTETLTSPEFTVNTEGCTWIKETAWTPGDGPNRTVLAEGYFGAANERTMWHTQPQGPPVNAGGTLPETGAGVTSLWAILAAISLLLGATLMGVAYRRRKRGEQS
jgi:LPXTG-motif cell wall-anchored protein